jgi:single-strand DNA-binding protein
MIEGRLKLDTWEKDGKKNSKLRVVGEKMVLLGNKGEGPRGGGQARSTTRAPGGSRQPAGGGDDYSQSEPDYDGGPSSGGVAAEDDIPF